MPPSKSSLTVTLLGTGTSTGIPLIGCDCAACTSTDPRDRRTRTSCLVEADGRRILIDAGPDFRGQALRENIRRLDALLVTHHHFDHIVGLDDLRPFFIRNKRPMPCFAHPATARVLRRMFPYIFGEHPYATAPRLTLQEVSGRFLVSGRHGDDDAHDPTPVAPIALDHGEVSAYGYRIGRFAYLTDTHHIPEQSYSRLEGLDVLVLDALRERPHPTHYAFDDAIAAARRIGARQTYFTHMTHDVLHREVDDRLPEGISLGYDGLRFTVG